MVELNSAFSTILPYVLSEKLKIEFQDVDGAALNASAIVAENYLMESTPQVDLRVVHPIRLLNNSPTPILLEPIQLTVRFKLAQKP